jgi:hypothetical protein
VGIRIHLKHKDEFATARFMDIFIAMTRYFLTTKGNYTNKSLKRLLAGKHMLDFVQSLKRILQDGLL